MKSLFSILVTLTITQFSFCQVMTSFNPKTDGFQFSNNFKVSAGDAGSIKADWGGLCGGMTFSSADYFYTRTKTPSQKYTPAQGSRLYNYLYNRQQDALLCASIDKVAENWFNPLGSRNQVFWGWAVDERLHQLKSFIDQDRPVPILLFNALNNDVAKNHWVLAIGYDLGGYKFNKKNDANVENIKIFVYDPNIPKNICVMRPKVGGDWLLEYHIWDEKNKKLGYKLDRGKRQWRHYYVYTEYKSKKPSIVKEESKTDSDEVYKLVVKFKTGDDDLRGGNDNVDILVKYKNGTSEMFKNINKGKRWSDRSSNNVEIRLHNKVNSNQISCFNIITTFNGGWNGDNWNVDWVTITAYKKNGETEILQSVSGKPWKRFTGDKKEEWICTKHTNANFNPR